MVEKGSIEASFCKSCNELTERTAMRLTVFCVTFSFTVECGDTVKEK